MMGGGGLMAAQVAAHVEKPILTRLEQRSCRRKKCFVRGIIELIERNAL
jgi:hypothetical protein